MRNDELNNLHKIYINFKRILNAESFSVDVRVYWAMGRRKQNA